MLQKVSYQLSNIIAKHVSADEDTREVYQYALELIITTVIGFAAILFIAGITAGWIHGLVFLLSFSTLRSVAGGYHAETYFKCFMISCGLFVVVICIHSVLLYIEPRILWVFLIALSAGIYIILRAPVKHANQPLNEARIAINRRLAKVFVILELVILCALSCFRYNLMLMVMLSICLVALMMLPSDRKSWRKGT